jgi:hypothetical protein
MRKNQRQGTNLIGFLMCLSLILALAGCGSSAGTQLSSGPGGGGGTGGGGGGGGTGEAVPCTFTPPASDGTTSGPVSSTPIQNQFFGMHISSPGVPWPFFSFGAQRLWAAGVAWGLINPVQGQAPDFTFMDQWFSDPQQHGYNVDFLYNLGRTPQWASQSPNDNSCPNLGAGGCDPPLDLNSDGSGSDDIWIAWVTAVAQHSADRKAQGLSGISYYEIWNEWNTNTNWTGTTSQLVRLEQDARCVIKGPPPGLSCYPGITFPSGGIDPTAQIVSPPPVGAHSRLFGVSNYLSTYFQTQVNGNAGGSFSDVIGFHGYVGTSTTISATAVACPVPEDVNTVIADMNATLAANSSITSGKPLFNTEGGWSEADVEGFTDRDRQAAFLPRYLLLQQSGNISRVYWFEWDSKELASLYYDVTGETTLAATAYGEVNKWTVGATLTQACSAPGSAKGTIWTCGFTRPGYAALAVWDAGQDCTSTNCPTTTYTVPAGGYIEYRDVAGNVTSLNGSSSVQIGAKPILLETSPLP